MEAKIIKGGQSYVINTEDPEPPKGFNIKHDNHKDKQFFRAKYDKPDDARAKAAQDAIEEFKDRHQRVVNPDDIVGKCKIAYNQFCLSEVTIAQLLVAEIRAIYSRTIVAKAAHKYDLEILNYLDKILFGPLANLIEGIVRYKSEIVDISLAKGLIKNGIDAVDLQVDIDQMYAIIDRIYEEF